MQQKELDLLEFQDRFPNEQACRDYLIHQRWPYGFRCPRCGHDQASIHRTKNLYQCNSCRYQASITAGTIFHKTRTPLRKWFWMILFMARYKSGVSILSLQKMLGIKNYKTAWLMGHKIRHAMAERDAQYQLEGLIEIDDGYFGGSKPGKPGRGASGKSKIVLAIENHGNSAGFAKAFPVSSVSQVSVQKAFHGLIAQGSTVRSDGWGAYDVLQSETISHEKVKGAGRKGVENLPWVHILISNIKMSIRGVYRGVSHKHIFRYLAEFCYRLNRRFWESQLFDRLLYACTLSSTVTYAELSQ